MGKIARDIINYIRVGEIVGGYIKMLYQDGKSCRGI